MGAAPRRAVIRENSDPGDIIILLGGRTGRDGIGGATGSPRFIQKLLLKYVALRYRKVMLLLSVRSSVCSVVRKSAILSKNVMTLVRGGVSVAIGELAAGLRVDLDKVPKKICRS